MDRELHHELRTHGVEHYRRAGKALLRAVRAGDTQARARAHAALGERTRERFVLADALHVVAVEHGDRSWPAFKHRILDEADGPVRPVGRISASPAATYLGWANQLLDAARVGEPDAVERLRARVPRLADRDLAITTQATLADAQLCLAREYGFRTWRELARAANRASDTHYSRLSAHWPWKRAQTAINQGDTSRLRELLHQHSGLEHQNPGMTLLGAAAQPEAADVPREIVDVLIEAGSDLDVPLNLAACFNKSQMVGWLLDAGADPTATPIWGITPLQTAVYHGAREATDLLVTRTGLQPDALYIAAAADDVQRLATWFTDQGVLRAEAMRDRPNLCDVGWPPTPPTQDDPADVLAEALALAAQQGRTRACNELLDRGADSSRAPLYGITPLHFAASMNRSDTVEALVRRGAPLDARDQLHHGTPLDWAIHNGVTEAALLELLR